MTTQPDSRSEFVRAATWLNMAHPEWRWGQTLFNHGMQMLPEQTEALRGSLRDPFNRDDRAGDFLDALFDSEVSS